MPSMIAPRSLLVSIRRILHSTGGVLDARIGASHRYGMDWTDYPESSVRWCGCSGLCKGRSLYMFVPAWRQGMVEVEGW